MATEVRHYDQCIERVELRTIDIGRLEFRGRAHVDDSALI